MAETKLQSKPFNGTFGNDGLGEKNFRANPEFSTPTATNLSTGLAPAQAVFVDERADVARPVSWS